MDKNSKGVIIMRVSEYEFERTYSYSDERGTYYSMLTFYKCLFDEAEIDFIDELMKSMDYGNIMLAKAIVDNKHA